MNKLPFEDPAHNVTPENRRECLEMLRKIKLFPLHENLLATSRLRETGVFKWKCFFYGDCYRFNKEGIEVAVKVEALNAPGLFNTWLHVPEIMVDSDGESIIHKNDSFIYPQMGIRVYAKKPGFKITYARDDAGADIEVLSPRRVKILSHMEWIGWMM